MVNQQGETSAIQIDIAEWQALLTWLAELEDEALVHELAERLRAEPAGDAGTWAAIKHEWDSLRDSNES